MATHLYYGLNGSDLVLRPFSDVSSWPTLKTDTNLRSLRKNSTTLPQQDRNDGT